MKIIDKHRCINNYPEHQNDLSDSLYYESVSKDHRGHEGPQASFETINNSCELLKFKNSSKFKIGKYAINIICSEKDID